MSATAYIAFLKTRHELDVQSLFSIPADERELLEIVAVHDAQSKPLTVTQFMALTHLASPATLHRKMSALLEKKLIVLLHKGKDRRTKFICLNDAAMGYFAKAGLALAAAKEAV